jgi:hypothetical protein
MKLHQYVLLASIGIFCNLSIHFPAFANENPCSSIVAEPNSSKTREINLKKYGVRFKIPANYKTKTYVHDGQMQVLVMNPSDVKYLDCLAKNRIGTEYSGTGADLQIGSVPRGATLVETAKAFDNPQAQFGMRELEHTKIAGQPALKYKVMSLGQESPVLFLFTPNQKTFLRIRYEPAGIDSRDLSKEVADLIAKSLVLPRK